MCMCAVHIVMYIADAHYEEAELNTIRGRLYSSDHDTKILNQDNEIEHFLRTEILHIYRYLVIVFLCSLIINIYVYRERIWLIVHEWLSPG